MDVLPVTSRLLQLVAKKTGNGCVTRKEPLSSATGPANLLQGIRCGGTTWIPAPRLFENKDSDFCYGPLVAVL